MSLEQGIGGLKKKWKCLMKRFNSTQPKFTHIFQVTTILTSFLHKRCMDLMYEVVGDRNPNPTTFMASKEAYNYKSKIFLTCVINSSSNITPKSLIALKLLILIFFFHSLLISTLPIKKTSQISEVEA